MKRFRWPLQRLLEVTLQRERALQVELFRLSRQIAAVHQEIFRRRAAMRVALAELAQEALARRLARQQIFMEYSAAEEVRLDRLREELKNLQERRTETMTALAKKRTSRKALERLREQAFGRHVREMTREEQKQLDESSQVAFVNKMLQQQDVAASPCGPVAMRRQR